MAQRKRDDREKQRSRDNDDRYRAYINNTNEGIWCIEFDRNLYIDAPEDEQFDLIYKYGYIAEANDAYARSVGYQHGDDLVGKRLEEYLPQSDPTNIATVKAHIRGHYSVTNAESVEIFKGGIKRVFLNNSTGIIEDGRVVRVWGTQTDITDQKVLEEKLRNAEQMYRTVADFTYDWEYWEAPDGTLIYVSPSCERITGYDVQEFIANPSLLRAIIMPEDKDIWDDHARKSRQKFKKRELQFRMQRRDGEIRWIEHACQPVYDDQGNPSGIRASNRDITERKQFEIALAQSKNFNQSTLDSLQYQIAVLDQEGNILGVNESWLQFARENDAGSLDRLGIGSNYLNVCRRSPDSSEKTAQAALEGIQSVLDGFREHFGLEYPCDSPVEKRWFLMRVTPFRGHKGGVIISHTNITERKFAQIDLQEAYTEIEQLKNQLEAETAYLQEEIKLEHDFEFIIGNSPAIRLILFKVEQVADTDATVLVLGETGTGKELISRAIHNSSSRKQHPLVKVNCAALPSNLIESELFGHEPGAFTDARARQIGRFEVAHGTSIFLDEIGDLPLELQTKLLRVLQDGEFERLGSSRTMKVNVRIIAATNRDLEAQVRQGDFRKDLFFPLKCVPNHGATSARTG